MSLVLELLARNFALDNLDFWNVPVMTSPQFRLPTRVGKYIVVAPSMCLYS